jgi:hypothetical protein
MSMREGLREGLGGLLGFGEGQKVSRKWLDDRGNEKGAFPFCPVSASILQVSKENARLIQYNGIMSRPI